MEGSNAFATFIDLIKFDQETVKLLSQIENIKKNIEVYEVQKLDFVNSLESSKSHLKESEKDVHLQELRMKELNEKEKQKKEQLSNSDNQKEQQALKREIESIKRSQHGYETELVNSWNKLEVAKKDFEESSSKIEDKVKEFEQKIKEEQKELDSLQKELEKRSASRESKQKGVPEDWLDRYNVMSHQVPDPVVEIVGQSCSACFFDLPHQEFLNLKKKKMIQCKGCFRLIYYSE